MEKKQKGDQEQTESKQSGELWSGSGKGGDLRLAWRKSRGKQLSLYTSGGPQICQLKVNNVKIAGSDDQAKKETAMVEVMKALGDELANGAIAFASRFERRDELMHAHALDHVAAARVVEAKAMAGVGAVTHDEKEGKAQQQQEVQQQMPASKKNRCVHATKPAATEAGLEEVQQQKAAATRKTGKQSSKEIPTKAAEKRVAPKAAKIAVKAPSIVAAGPVTPTKRKSNSSSSINNNMQPTTAAQQSMPLPFPDFPDSPCSSGSD